MTRRLTSFVPCLSFLLLLATGCQPQPTMVPAQTSSTPPLIPARSQNPGTPVAQAAAQNSPLPLPDGQPTSVPAQASSVTAPEQLAELSRVQGMRLSLSHPFLARAGETVQVRASLLDALRQELPGSLPLLRWSSSRPELFSVNAQGLVRALQASGKAEIRAEIPGTGHWAQLSVEMSNTGSLCGSNSCSGGGGGGGGGGGNSPAEVPLQAVAEQPANQLAPVSDWLPWSEEASWARFGAHKPLAGEAVTIPAGYKILLDESTPDLAGINVDGELRLAENQTLTLQADYIMVHGALLAGSAHAAYSGRATITLDAQNSSENIHGMGTRGIFSMGGRIELFGHSPATVWTQLSAHAPAGGTSLNLLAAQGWQAGDQIVIAPTDFYGTGASERLQLANVQGNTVSLTQPIESPRWGQLQYLSPQGLSISPTGYAPQNGTPTVLDERAPVGNLSRNLVIQGADDILWQSQGFGAQVMIMGAASVTRIQGVELRRVGQAARLGRYPLHFHMLSYDANSGAEIPSQGVRELRNNAIWNSSNRCITVHGTNDTTVDNNICYDITGHAVFLEDAVERRNQITRNLVMRVRRPADPNRALLRSDLPDFQRGPSGFWLTNPDNTVTDNHAADAEGNGFWLAFPEAALGLSRNVQMRPNRMPFGTFSRNTSHSNGTVGVQLDWVPFNAAGETQPRSYAPSSDNGAAGPYSNWVRFGMSEITTFKNLGNGFWNRATWPDYDRWISADNLDVFFSGAGADGNIRNSLVVGESLNNRTTWQQVYPTWVAPNRRVPPVAFASYHSTFNMVNNTVVNFPYVSGEASGAFRTTDYYITPVDRGPARNANNLLISTHPGYRTPVQPAENFTLAGALWDANGYWGPAGNYWVYDTPYLTAGANCQPVLPAGENGMSCAAEYYGVTGFVVDGSERYMPTMPIRATRYDNAGQIIGHWEVGNGLQATQLANMRHFAMMRNGRYFLDFPGIPVPTRQVEMDITNAYRPEDSALLGVRYGGSQPAVSVRNPYGRLNLTSVNSLAEVESGPGNRFWHDTTNQTLWVRLRPPANYPASSEPFSDQTLYQGYRLYIESP